MLKPFKDEEIKEAPTPSNVGTNFNFEPVNAFDLLIKGKEDRDRAVENNAKTAVDVTKFDPISDILIAAGVKEAPEDSDKEAITGSVIEVFENAGGTLKEAAKAIVEVMKFGDKATEKLSAARLVAQIHGALEIETGNKMPVVNFNILPLTATFAKNNILNLVVPRA